MTNRIYNKEAFVQSALFNGSLLEYPTGAMLGTDLDLIAERRGNFVVAETKKFWDGEATIPFGQQLMLKRLNQQLENSTLFYIATDSYSATNPDDHIWYITIDEMEKNPSQNQRLLKKEIMHKISKKKFNALVNNIINGGSLFA